MHLIEIFLYNITSAACTLFKQAGRLQQDEMDYPPFFSNDRRLQEVFCFPPTASLSLLLEPESKYSISYVYLESHRALVMEHDSVVLFKTATHHNTCTEQVCIVYTKIFPAFRNSLERRNWGREVSIKWSCQMLVIFICSDWKRIRGRGNIKTYFCIQIELDKWQFFMEISLEQNFFAGYLTRDQVPKEGEMRECLQGQTEDRLYAHRQRG